MRYLILFSFCVILAAASFAQSSTINRQLEDRVQAIRERELADSKKWKLWKYGDAYKRFVRIRAARELGLGLEALNAKVSNEPLFDITEKDTNVSNNSSSQNETTIAINRKNKKLIIAGANDARMYTNGMPVFRSTDGGLKWQTRWTKPASTYLPLGDPIIAASDEGTFYYSHLIAGGGEGTNIGVSRSTDGLTWTKCANVVEEEIFFEDKEMIVVDNSPSSQWYGRVYVIWNRFDADYNTFLTLAYSDDKGDSWKIVEEIAYSTAFPVIKIGPSGEVILGCNSVSETEEPIQRLLISTDGGNTFKEIFRSIYEELPTNVEFRPSLKGDTGPRVYPFTSFDVDLKVGMLHLVTGSWNGDASQLYYRYSTDMGKSWSNSQTVGIADPGSNDILKDRFFPNVTVDQITGDVYVLYYSSEADPDNVLTGVMRQKLTPVLDQHQRQVSSAVFDPRNVDVSQSSGTSFIGDYIGSDAFDSVYAACWTGLKANRKDGEVFAYVAKPFIAQDTTTGHVLPTVIYSNKPAISWISPNPSMGTRLTVAYYTPRAADVVVELYTLDAKLFAQLFSGTVEEGASQLEVNIPFVDDGGYFLKVTSGIGSAEHKLVIAR